MAVTRRISFLLKRGTAAQWAAAGNPVLREGEPGVLVDPAGPETMKVGDGVTPFSGLPAVNPGPDGSTAGVVEALSDPESAAHAALVAEVGTVSDPATACTSWTAWPPLMSTAGRSSR